MVVDPEQLFLLEVFVSSITFGPKLVDVNKEDVLVRVRFIHLVNFDIEAKFFLLPDEVDTEDKTTARTFNMGKSFLFPCTIRQLAIALRKELLELAILIREEEEGSVEIPFTNAFGQMLKNFQTLGIVKATRMEKMYLVKNSIGEDVAKIDMFVRLSCFGNNVQTNFQIRNTEDGQEFLFKSNNTSKLLKCERVEENDLETSPMAPFFQHVAIQNADGNDSTVNLAENVSLTPMYDAMTDLPSSPYQQQSELSTALSMYDRPDEKKFLNREKSVNKLQTVLSDEDITIESVKKHLCKNKGCPAAKLFKEYGLGPLATGRGLGTLYGNVEPSVTYGMSHTYGTMDRYGPYGVFSRPKRPELPFVPGNHGSQEPHPQRHSITCPLSRPLRLRGGGEDDENGTQKSQLKSPFEECKSVLNQFDEILSSYRKALGPCGQPICPFAQNFAEDNCKKACESKKTSEENETCDNSPCQISECPYKEQPKNTVPSACGSPRCAYTKYKMGLVDDDAELELYFLPPAVAGRCGHPQCKYLFQPPLPPIHWDCPDPLPKGNCKNPNCPHQPPDLRKLKVKEKKAPCGSVSCPYAIPPPCGLPVCPFNTYPCPFAAKEQNTRDDVCENPECPFSGYNNGDNIDDNVTGSFEVCENPDCPYAQKEPTIESEDNDLCDNPDCIYAKRPTKEEDSESICTNPDCPANQNRKRKVVDDDDDDLCDNPDCPYNQMRNEPEDMCDNPDCPHKPKPQPPKKPICQDPYCPYGQPLPSCGIPNCPFEPVPMVCYPPPCIPPPPPCGAPPCSPTPCYPPPCEPAPCYPPPCCVPPVEKKTFKDKIDNRPVKPISLKFRPPPNGETQPNARITDQSITTAASEMDAKTPSANGLVKEKKKKKRKSKFVYSIGDKYPGVLVGHKECVLPSLNVPKKMGWLWNIHTPILRLKPRRGWKPGAIQKSIAARIRAHREAKGLGMLRVPFFAKGGGENKEEYEKEVVPKPTLQIKKKDGCYFVTMNPLKDPHTLVDREDPYMECTPMTFKITKNKPPPDPQCTCDGEEVPEASDSSDSELDIEFTPPAGIIHPERFKKKPNVIHTDTQYNPKDCAPKKGKGAKGKGAKGKGKSKDKGKPAKGGKKGKK